MDLHPYLAFDGTCEEALNFYRACFGGEFESLNRFKDGPDEMGGMTVPENMKEKIMHMTWRFDDNVVMASDTFSPAAPSGSNVSLSVHVDDPDTLDTIFGKLSEGGHVILPPEDTFWGARFTMFTDQYGINWMLNRTLQQPNHHV